MTYSLSGRTVLLTRPYQSAVEDKKLVENHQGHALIVPLIDTTYVKSDNESAILSNFDSYSWIVFTSRNAAIYTLNVLEKADLLDSLRKLHIASIGKKTSSYIEEKGFTVAFTPQSYRAIDFVKEFPLEKVAGKRVLFPQGNLARNVAMNTFKQYALQCDSWVLYRTIKLPKNEDKLLNALNNEMVDVITFASPSAVVHFAEIVGKIPGLFHRVKHGDWTIASIGPTTSDEIRHFQLPVHIESKAYTMNDMVEEIAQFYKEQN